MFEPLMFDFYARVSKVSKKKKKEKVKQNKHFQGGGHGFSDQNDFFLF